MTKTGSRNKNINFCQNLTKFTKFSLFDKWLQNWLQNYFKLIYYNKHSVSDSEKMAKFLAKFFKKFALFDKK